MKIIEYNKKIHNTNVNKCTVYNLYKEYVQYKIQMEKIMQY